MKSSRTSRCIDGRRAGGFTLVEILVALTILGLLVLTFAQIFGTSNTLWLYGKGKVNNFTKGRAMLSLLEADIRCGVFRPDVAAFPGGSFKLYTTRAGVPLTSGPLRNVSLIQYTLANGSTNGLPTCTLERYDMPVNWTDPSTYLAFGNSSGFTSPAAGATNGTLTPRDTAPGVLAFQLVFVQADGTFSTTAFNPAFTTAGTPAKNPTRAIGITLSVIDDQGLRLLSASQVSTLQACFTSALSSQSSPSVKACWEQYLKTSMSWSSYPKALGTGIGVYESYVSLP